MIAHATVERNYGAIFSGPNVPNQGILVYGIAHKRKKIGL
jgi:hypothetical protein